MFCLCVCVFVCIWHSIYKVCMHACVYTFTFMYIYIYIHTHIHINKHTRAYIHTNVRTYIQATPKNRETRTGGSGCASNTYILTYVRTYIHTGDAQESRDSQFGSGCASHTYIHSYTHTYVHTYIQVTRKNRETHMGGSGCASKKRIAARRTRRRADALLGPRTTRILNMRKMTRDIGGRFANRSCSTC